MQPRTAHLLTLACALSAAMPAPAAAAEGAPPPDWASCDACHGELRRRNVQHEAFSGGSCGDCHAPATAAGRGRCGSKVASSWKPVAPPAELCAQCHDAAEMTKALAVKHAPVTAYRCVECHDPHGSDRPHLVRLEGRSLCLRCHSVRAPAGLARARVDGGRFAHSGFGDCSDCHEGAHGGARAKLLQEAEPALCHRCHDRKDAAPFVHDAIPGGGCTSCHAAHTGAAPGALRVPAEELCDDCHPQDGIATKAVRHAPAVERRCLACHDPHGASFQKLLRVLPDAGCLGCHGPAAAGPAAAPRMRVDPGRPHVHGPVASGACSTCHVAGHSGDREGLLVDEQGALCRRCHDEVGRGRFPHGAVRLGQCTGCHDPHASERPRLLARATVREACFGCHHDSVTWRAVPHAPVSDGDCTECHAPHSAVGPALLPAGSVRATCSGCHSEVGRKKVKHAAVERYGCTVCHDPHGAAKPLLLARDVNATCLVCHPQATPAHVPGTGSAGHPLRGGPDPVRLDREFGCASCHDPHGSDSPSLLRTGPTTMASCDGCHGVAGGGADLVGDREARKRAAERR